MDVIQQEEQYQKALNAAAKQLSYRALSQEQLRDKLLAKGVAEDAVEYAVAWLEARGLLDDAAFAASVTRSYRKRGYGLLRIRQELRQRGISREIADAALAHWENDLGAMTALLEKRLHGDLSDRRTVDKAIAALQRRGYRWDEIRKALQAYGTESPADLSDASFTEE